VLSERLVARGLGFVVGEKATRLRHPPLQKAQRDKRLRRGIEREGSIMDAILTRRSIRHYTAQPVAEELITGFLKAAMAAPSAGNEQPWEFVVLTERTILDRIPSFHPYAAMLKEAPAAILVCGDLAREKHEGYWVQDCSAATENILIAVKEKGLGAVWLGIYPREERVRGLRQLLSIPETIVPFALVAIGYPAEKKEPADRFDASRLHYNSW
jgi:nitroreductase